MYNFLQQFFVVHPEYSARDFFVFGESYAGHYVPAVTHLIWKNNQKLPQGAIKINLKGTSVGNGLTDPSVQYKYYADMAHSTNHHAPTVNETGYELMKAATVPCIAAIDACQATTASCLVATDICNLALIEPYQLSGRNPYDMRIKCAVPPLCYDFSNVATYLARPEVVAYLGVAGHKWQDCNHAVAIAFELGGDWMHDYEQDIPDQLAAGIRVLMYAGDQVCLRPPPDARPSSLACATASPTHTHAYARTRSHLARPPAPTHTYTTVGSGLHLQLAWEPGVDQRTEVARAGAIQRECVPGGMVR